MRVPPGPLTCLPGACTACRGEPLLSLAAEACLTSADGGCRLPNAAFSLFSPPPAGEFETIPADIVLKSIGFKSVGIPGAAFDGRKGVVPNRLGQVGGLG